MKRIDPKDISVQEMYSYLVGSIAPRPIAFVSTIDLQGKVNLSPYSFFNVFGVNPPTLIFSPTRRGRDNSLKHTLENIQEKPEVVVNIVDYSMVEQMSLASTEYPKGVNEFLKAGFNELASEKVAPPRVAESPVSFECFVQQVIPTGNQGGAGNLVICEIVLAHIKESILDEEGSIDPKLLDAVARMGNNWYCRANRDALFEIKKPIKKQGIGVDSLPDHIRLSEQLSGNDLGKLANVERLPSKNAIIKKKNSPEVQQIFRENGGDIRKIRTYLQTLAKKYLSENQIIEALEILLIE